MLVLNHAEKSVFVIISGHQTFPLTFGFSLVKFNLI